MAPPENVSKVRSFLNIASPLAEFLFGLSELTKPLLDLLNNGANYCRGERQQKRFDFVKRALTTTPVLEHNYRFGHLTVSADASLHGLGAVLLQEMSGR